MLTVHLFLLFLIFYYLHILDFKATPVHQEISGSSDHFIFELKLSLGWDTALFLL